MGGVRLSWGITAFERWELRPLDIYTRVLVLAWIDSDFQTIDCRNSMYNLLSGHRNIMWRYN